MSKTVPRSALRSPQRLSGPGWDPASGCPPRLDPAFAGPRRRTGRGGLQGRQPSPSKIGPPAPTSRAPTASPPRLSPCWAPPAPRPRMAVCRPLQRHVIQRHLHGLARFAATARCGRSSTLQCWDGHRQVRLPTDGPAHPSRMRRTVDLIQSPRRLRLSQPWRWACLTFMPESVACSTVPMPRSLQRIAWFVWRAIGPARSPSIPPLLSKPAHGHVCAGASSCSGCGGSFASLLPGTIFSRFCGRNFFSELSFSLCPSRIAFNSFPLNRLTTVRP